jgi:chemotaxis protein CheZ
MTKRFRIEGRAMAARLPGWSDVAPGAPDGRDGAEGLRAGPAAGAAGKAAAPAPESGRMRHVHGELQAMKDAIALTKRELAALHRSSAGRDGMQRVAGELDAVAAATEQATTTILGAVEDIEGAANMLRGAAPGALGDHVATILDRVILLYETCNFQDLTGQRIEKVVGTLKFVEERLDAMIAAWDGPARLMDEPGIAPDEPHERRFLSGPALPGEERVSQTDIDALFS